MDKGGGVEALVACAHVGELVQEIYASLSIHKLLPDQKPVSQLEEKGAEIFV